MSSKINQKEYLKKYLTGDVSKEKKKKKKRPIAGQTVTIIDDDVDVSKMQHLHEDDIEVLTTAEDAPQVVGVIDDRPPELRAQDFKNSSKWKLIADDNGFESSLTVQQLDRKSGRVEKSHSGKHSKKRSTSKKRSSSSSDLSPVRHRKSRSDTPPRRKKSRDLSPKRKRSPDLSPKRRRDSSSSTGRSMSSDLFPRRKRSSNSSHRRRTSRDLSPKRRKRSPNSPPRRKRSPDSPPRRNRSPDTPPRRKRSPDTPPRRKRSPDSPPRRKRSPDSPPRRKRSPDSPPRRKRSPDSPPRRKRSPDSPPRRKRSPEFSSDWRKKSPDLSPKRHRKRHESPLPHRGERNNPFYDSYRNRSPQEVQRNSDRSYSPPWKQDRNRGGFQYSSNRGRDSSYGRGGGRGRGFENRQNQPQRDYFRNNQANSFERNRGDFPKSGYHGDRKTPDWSPQKASTSTEPAKGSFGRPFRPRDDFSQRKREVTPDWDAPTQGKPQSPAKSPKQLKSTTPDRSPDRAKMQKTLEGKTAGLQDAKSLRVESDKIRKRDADAFNQMSDDVSGRNASMVVRDKRTGKVRDLEREAEKEREKDRKEEEKKAVYDRWGKGVKQVEDYRQKMDEEVHEMNKPLARYSDDADLDKYLKQQEREGDPMLEYMRQKDREKQKDSKTAAVPIYKGSYPENRLGIRPGYRWDGVDRSNGYEKKWFDVQNKKKAIQEEAYRYSTEDL